jgi:hypothetical protein
MRRLILAAALSVMAVSIQAEPLTAEAIQSMNNKKVEENLPDSHPAAYTHYAIKLFKAGKQDLGVRWYYVGQIRYRAHLLSNPELTSNPDVLATGDAAEFNDINKNVGPAITDWAGGNVRVWVQSINEALAWDASHPNNFTSKEEHGPQIQEARDEVARTRDAIKKSEAQIKAERAARGLTDR